MKFALVNGKRTEATKGAKGRCQGCDSELIARCGEIRIHHWAHKGNRNCDALWENETEWHRAWKEYFPIDWQEVIHKDKNGEKHIADVKTDQNWVLEFQHSYLKPEERRSRDAFYQKLAWVVDGTRRKRDEVQLAKILDQGTIVNPNVPIRRVNIGKCALLREWGECSASVFFDFAKDIRPKVGALWWLLPGSSNGIAYIVPFSRAEFVKLHSTEAIREGLRFEEMLEIYRKLVSRNNPRK